MKYHVSIYMYIFFFLCVCVDFLKQSVKKSMSRRRSRVSVRLSLLLFFFFSENVERRLFEMSMLNRSIFFSFNVQGKVRFRIRWGFDFFAQQNLTPSKDRRNA